MASGFVPGNIAIGGSIEGVGDTRLIYASRSFVLFLFCN